jgi:hypothetical protein
MFKNDENLRNELVRTINSGYIKAELIRPTNGSPYILYEDSDEDYGIIFINENGDVKHISPINLDSLDYRNTTGVETYYEKDIDTLMGMLRRAYTVYIENVEYLKK